MDPKSPHFKIFILYPFVVLYRASSLVHKKLFLRQPKEHLRLTPLLRIGGLCSGGEHKTPVTQHLCHYFSKRGYSCAILAYDIYNSGKGNDSKVLPQAPIIVGSDEAQMHANTSGSPVFITRNRFKSWKKLSTQGFDLILSDGGIEDPRLDTAYTICLKKYPFPKSLKNLLPIGRHRSFLTDHPTIQEIWYHNSIVPEQTSIDTYSFSSESSTPLSASGVPLPQHAAVTVITAIADNCGLLRHLQHSNYTIQTVVSLTNHTRTFAQKLEYHCNTNPNDFFVITDKDAVKCSTDILKKYKIYTSSLSVSTDRNLNELEENIFRN
ncbi:MAG: tetraacyldisaccharide 4'-kinase [Fibrobacterales bacterium]